MTMDSERIFWNINYDYVGPGARSLHLGDLVKPWEGLKGRISGRFLGVVFRDEEISTYEHMRRSKPTSRLKTRVIPKITSPLIRFTDPRATVFAHRPFSVVKVLQIKGHNLGPLQDPHLLLGQAHHHHLNFNWQTLQPGALVKALTFLDQQAANIPAGYIGVVTHVQDAFGDGCGPQVTWTNGHICNIYGCQVGLVKA